MLVEITRSAMIEDKFYGQGDQLEVTPGLYNDVCMKPVEITPEPTPSEPESPKANGPKGKVSEPKETDEELTQE